MSKFNAGAIKTIDQNTVESDGTQFPAISFHNGDLAQRKAGGVSYEGGWFISEDGAPADMTAYGWTKDSFVNRNGEEIPGYWAHTVAMSIICGRKRWIVNGQPFAWSQFDKAKESGSPRGHQQYLVLLKGAEELGPFVVGMKGHAGMAFSGSRQYSSTGVLSCFNRTVIAAANIQTKPQKWPFRAFWLTVGAGKDAKGLPAFVDVGAVGATSKVVLPMPVGLPDKASAVSLDEYYVGDDVLAQVNQLFEEALPWAGAWTTFNGSKQESAKDDEPEEATAEDLAAQGL